MDLKMLVIDFDDPKIQDRLSKILFQRIPGKGLDILEGKRLVEALKEVLK